MKRASEIFGPVDPHLTVISGRRYRQGNWEASGGAVCPRCHSEVVRFRPEDGVCRQCGNVLNEKEFSDKIKQAKFQKFRKAHNARIDRGKGKGTAN